jgi:hypothetical protein
MTSGAPATARRLSPMEADWRIDPNDLIGSKGRATTMSETFTRISVRYTDANDGSQQEVHADAPESGLGLTEKVIKVPGPMTREAAQQLAQAALVLGRSPIKRYWITINGSQPLQHRSGAERPARDIAEGDTVLLSLQPEDGPLHIFDVREDEDDLLRLAMADQDLSARLDTDLRLMLAREPEADST